MSGDERAPGAGPAWGRVLLVDGAVRVWCDGRGRVVDAGGLALAPGDLVELAGDRVVALLQRPLAAAAALRPEADFGRLASEGGRRHAALLERAAVLAALRRYLDRRGFVEVDTPAIAPSPGLELHLDAIEVRMRQGMAGAPVRRWLVTSPEYHCKRLLHAGMGAIYSLGKAFRSGERGAHHNPEFTMLEWYRALADSRAAIADTLALLRVAATAVQRTRARRGDGRPVWRPTAPRRLSFLAALRQLGGVVAADARGRVLPLAALRQAAAAAGVDVRAGDDEATILLQIFAERVEPALAAHDLVVVWPWPASLASLARPLPGRSDLADRFEVFARGVELANGFGELTDAVEQRRRLLADRRARRAREMPTYPVDERFVAALERGCPPAAGVALGVDRLVMAVGGYTSIDEVTAFVAELA